MKVKVQYFAAVRELAERTEEVVDVKESATVLDVLSALAKGHGERFREYVFDSLTGKPKAFLQFLLNEDLIMNPNGLSTVLTDNSRLAIIPPVGGG